MATRLRYDTRHTLDCIEEDATILLLCAAATVLAFGAAAIVSLLGWAP
jgi:hypothetical protein